MGSFSSIKQGSKSFSRTDLVSFSASSPYTVTSWAPRVVGSTKTDQEGAAAINSIAFSGRKCSDAYIGGNFTKVNSTSATNIAEISTSTGNVVTGFAHSANGTVDTLAAVGGHLLVGGTFTSINGAGIPRMVSLSPSTGLSDGFLRPVHLGQLHGLSTSNSATAGRSTLSRATSARVGGVARRADVHAERQRLESQRDRVDLAHVGSIATALRQTFWARRGAWSPDDSTVYVATTGFHEEPGVSSVTGRARQAVRVTWPWRSTGHAGDRSARSGSTRLGCDSLYTTAADSKAAYFGGHERFSMNPNACDTLGPGGYNAPGMEGLSPANGALFVNSAGSAGFYRRARGLGADDMLVTSAGLWIASDNLDGSATCGGVSGHAGICLLPYG